jgi:acyl-CoA synthetase (AMP-forming)/AMP-acid ligase II
VTDSRYLFYALITPGLLRHAHSFAQSLRSGGGKKTGMIVDTGAWVIRNVSAQLALWRAAGLAVPIAINASGKELLFADPARVIQAETSRSKIPASLCRSLARRSGALGFPLESSP